MSFHLLGLFSWKPPPPRDFGQSSSHAKVLALVSRRGAHPGRPLACEGREGEGRRGEARRCEVIVWCTSVSCVMYYACMLAGRYVNIHMRNLIDERIRERDRERVLRWIRRRREGEREEWWKGEREKRGRERREGGRERANIII